MEQSQNSSQAIRYWEAKTRQMKASRRLRSKLFQALRVTGIGLSAFLKNVPNLAAMVALVLSTYSLIYLVRPAIKPPEKLGATITKVQLQRKVRYYEYHSRAYGQDVPNESDEIQDLMGTLVYIQVELQGFRERNYSTHPVLLDAKSQAQVFHGPKELASQLTSASQSFSPVATADKVGIRCWVADPSRKGKYFIRVELYDLGPKKDLPRTRPGGSGNLLDFVDTPKFDVG